MTSGKRDAAQPFNARHLHIVAFANEGASLAGEELLSHYPRLAHEAVREDESVVRWSASGRAVPVTGGSPEIWLDLQADAQIWLQCQRCLEPVCQLLSVQRSFRFVHNESAAAELDEEIDEDVLVYSKDFDLYTLMEDELLMELPVAPRHEECPQAPLMQTQTQDFSDQPEDKPHPFAALQALKKK